MSERMSDARAAALFERLRIVARGESSFPASSMEAIIEDWSRARAAEAAERNAERARADLAEQAQQAYAAKNAKLAEDLAAEHAEVIRLRLDVKAERARTEMVEQTRGGLLEENARLRAALKGLSVEEWWPDRQSHGPCWCAYNSADWADHAPRCKRAAEALGHREGVE